MESSAWYGFLLGSLSTCGAVTFTNPWEVVKTRLQLQGELINSSNLRIAPHYEGGVLRTFVTIFKNEGLYGIQKGLVPAYLYQICMNGVRFSLYDPMKLKIQEGVQYIRHEILAWDAKHTRSAQKPGSFLEDSNDAPPVLLVNLLSGFVSGATGAFAGSPFFLIKIRLQSYSPHLQIGHQHDYGGLWNALKSIYAQEGLKGLYRGTASGMLRTGIGSATQLSTYDHFKYWLMEYFNLSNSFSTHLIASMATGTAVVFTMNPFDVITTRMYNQKLDPKTGKGLHYTSIFDCMLKSIRTEGVLALYKGFWPHILRVGPHTVLTFVFLEQIKSFLSKAM